jgi:SAM-dependent methyltransferase
MSSEFSQGTMVHKLPKAPMVERIPHLVDLAAGASSTSASSTRGAAPCRSAPTAGCTPTSTRSRPASWASTSTDPGRDAGLRVRGLRRRLPGARRAQALDLAPAQLVIAGEVIEHVDDPGAFLAGLHTLVAPGGQLVITTPNAYGLFNVLASLAHREINHPDHVMMFTWQTLTNLAARHGWEPVDTHVYVPSVKDLSGQGLAARALGLVGRFAVLLERTLARLGRGYAADGLIIAFRATSPTR